MIIFLIGGLIIGGAVVAFALQNTAVVTLTLFAWQFESTLALIVILAIASGAFLGLSWSLSGSFKKSLRISNLEKQNSKLEKELANKNNELQSTPIKVAENNNPNTSI